MSFKNQKKRGLLPPSLGIEKPLTKKEKEEKKKEEKEKKTQLLKAAAAVAVEAEETRLRAEAEAELQARRVEVQMSRPKTVPNEIQSILVAPLAATLIFIGHGGKDVPFNLTLNNDSSPFNFLSLFTTVKGFPSYSASLEESKPDTDMMNLLHIDSFLKTMTELEQPDSIITGVSMVDHMRRAEGIIMWKKMIKCPPKETLANKFPEVLKKQKKFIQTLYHMVFRTQG